MYKRPIRWIAIGFAGLLAVIVILADFRHLPSYVTMLYSFPNGDRIGHFLLLGLFSLVVCMAFPIPRICFRKWNVPVPMLVLAAFIIGEEISQVFIPARTFSWGDLAASLAGWGMGWGFGSFLSRNPG